MGGRAPPGWGVGEDGRRILAYGTQSAPAQGNGLGRGARMTAAAAPGRRGSERSGGPCRASGPAWPERSDRRGCGGGSPSERSGGPCRASGPAWPERSDRRGCGGGSPSERSGGPCRASGPAGRSGATAPEGTAKHHQEGQSGATAPNGWVLSCFPGGA